MADTVDEPIEFLASFPPIQSAIKAGRDGARLQLDIPASEIPAIVRLVALQAGDKVLRVTITLEHRYASIIGAIEGQGGRE